MTRDEELAQLLEHAPGPCSACSHGDLVTHAANEQGQVPWEVYEKAHEDSGQPLALTFGKGLVHHAVLYAEAPDILRELIEARRLLRECNEHGLSANLSIRVCDFLNGLDFLNSDAALRQSREGE